MSVRPILKNSKASAPLHADPVLAAVKAAKAVASTKAFSEAVTKMAETSAVSTAEAVKILRDGLAGSTYPPSISFEPYDKSEPMAGESGPHYKEAHDIIKEAGLEPRHIRVDSVTEETYSVFILDGETGTKYIKNLAGDGYRTMTLPWPDKEIGKAVMAAIERQTRPDAAPSAEAKEAADDFVDKINLTGPRRPIMMVGDEDGYHTIKP